MVLAERKDYLIYFNRIIKSAVLEEDYKRARLQMGKAIKGIECRQVIMIGWTKITLMVEEVTL